MRYSVSVQDVEPRLVASAKGHARRDNLLEVAFPLADQVWAFLKEHTEIPQPGTNIWIYRSDGSEDGFQVEAGAEVFAAFESSGSVSCSQTPSGSVARAMHVGPYSGIPDAHQVVREWCALNGHALAGPNWEVYGHWNEDESKLETEVFHLLE